MKSYRFLDHDDAYREFKKLFADQPVLVENETPEGLPTSFRVVPIKPQLTTTIGNEFQNVPGVDQINTPAKEVKTLLNVTKWIRLGVLRAGRRAARVVAVPDREHDPARDLRAPA